MPATPFPAEAAGKAKKAPAKRAKPTWSSKREALYIGDRPNDAKWTMAVVDGEATSTELVALVWGYSPEGVARRAELIAAAPKLVEALEDFCAAAEYWAGCDEGISTDDASSEIMGSGGAWPAQAYDNARAILSLTEGDV